jgi:hypothetical protein
MPFTGDTTGLIGQKLHVRTVFGNGWVLCRENRPFAWLDVPPPFDVTLQEVLFDLEEARVLICEAHAGLPSFECAWGAFIARADPIMNLREEGVPCNILLSRSRPTISAAKPYPDPEFVTSNSESHVRGFGVLSLLK